MRKEKRKSFRSHTNRLELGMGQNLEGLKDFNEKKRFGLRDKSVRSRYLSLSKTGFSIDRKGIEEVSRIKS